MNKNNTIFKCDTDEILGGSPNSKEYTYLNTTVYLLPHNKITLSFDDYFIEAWYGEKINIFANN